MALSGLRRQYTCRLPTAKAALPQSGIQNGARRAPTSPAQRCFITPEGASPEPACKAKPITGRTLPAQGVSPAAGSTLAPQARQPSGIQLSAAIVALPPQHPAFSTISRAQAAAFWKSSSLGCFSASLRRASLSGVMGCTFSACSLRFPIWKE